MRRKRRKDRDKREKINRASRARQTHILLSILKNELKLHLRMFIRRDVERQVHRYRVERVPLDGVGCIYDDVFSDVEMGEILGEGGESEGRKFEREGTDLSIELGEEGGFEGFEVRESGEGGRAGDPAEGGLSRSCEEREKKEEGKGEERRRRRRDRSAREFGSPPLLSKKTRKLTRKKRILHKNPQVTRRSIEPTREGHSHVCLHAPTRQVNGLEPDEFDVELPPEEVMFDRLPEVEVDDVDGCSTIEERTGLGGCVGEGDDRDGGWGGEEGS